MMPIQESQKFSESVEYELEPIEKRPMDDRGCRALDHFEGPIRNERYRAHHAEWRHVVENRRTDGRVQHGRVSRGRTDEGYQGAHNLMPFEYESMRAKSQETLLEFLNSELRLGSTLIQSAQLSQDEGDVEHHEQAKRSAKRAVETVERFKSQVVDGKARDEIEKRLADLQKLMSAV
jgi:hypothetical protein